MFQAAKMLYFNYIMNANEAKDCGFVADVLSNKDLSSFMNNLYKLGELPLKVLLFFIYEIFVLLRYFAANKDFITSQLLCHIF